MKSILLSLSIILLLFFSGCKNNPVVSQSAVSSMAQKINDSRPYNLITISQGSNLNSYSSTDFKDAYAENGYFIIEFSSRSTVYYNLESVTSIKISKIAHTTNYIEELDININ